MRKEYKINSFEKDSNSPLEDKYSSLFGNAKTIRGQKVTKLYKKTREAIKYYIDETFVFLIEHNELMKMKKELKKNKSLEK